MDEDSKEGSDSLSKKEKKKKKKKKAKAVEEIISEVRESAEMESDVEEVDFWMPPPGERWDFDDGGDRWDSGSESGEETDGEIETGQFTSLLLNFHTNAVMESL